MHYQYNVKDEKNVQRKGKFEFHLRATSKPDLVRLYHQVLLRSMEFFWDREKYPVNLIVVLDDENPNDHDFGKSISTMFPHPTIVYEEPNPFYGTRGTIRMQWSMFWADMYATGEYIGFLDTDTLFVTLIDNDMLFEGNKPHVWGLFGKALAPIRQEVKDATRAFIGERQLFRAMNYFPVIIHVNHFSAIREHIAKVNGKSFNEAFSSIIIQRRDVCQFNIMMNYLWYFHRDEYVWHMEDNKISPGFDGPNEPTDFSVFTEEMLTPYPKLCVHQGYMYAISMKIRMPDKVGDYKIDDEKVGIVMKEGYCFSGGFQLTPDLCSEFNSSSVQYSLFEFEDHSWGWDDRCLSQQIKYYARFQRTGHKWNLELLDGFRSP